MLKPMIGMLCKLRKDEKGAALVEYSILIGLITAAVIALIVTVGGWVTDAWTTLEAALVANPVPGGDGGDGGEG